MLRLRIEQALFGYREGHNLMASSVTLPARVRQFLANMTDSSGPDKSEEFDGTYTGLPLLDTNFYAFFCTWYAPEMSRPGCMWSHVLLIDIADFARIPDLGVLRYLCRRPTLPLDLSIYDQSITHLALAPNSSLSYGTDQGQDAFLLEALYGREENVVILDDKSSTWEAKVFALWSQQWPRLRRNFAFSTGSLGDRQAAGVPFDLQIAPKSSQRLWGRSEIPTAVCSFPQGGSHLSLFSWTNLVSKDLNNGGPSQLRQFFFTFGSDIEKPRQAFSRLAMVYQEVVLNPSADWLNKLHCIAENFPNPSEALRLKEWVVTGKGDSSPMRDLERIWATTSFLLSANKRPAYLNVSLDHDQVASLLWTHKTSDVLVLLSRLVRQKENPTAVAFATAIANALNPHELRPISEQYPELVPIMLSHRPSLAQNVNTWTLRGHTQYDILEILEGLSVGPETWSKILTAMLVAATGIAVREVVKKAEPYAMQGAFGWFDHEVSTEYLPSQIWREALAESAADLLISGKLLTPLKLAFCSWIVSPRKSREILHCMRQDVQHLAEMSIVDLPRPLRSHVAFLLVTLGLRATNESGLTPLISGFFEVHQRLATGDYSSDSWQILSPELPSLGMWWDDRCEKLRRATRDWLLRYIQSGNPLLHAAKNLEQRDLARGIFGEDVDRNEFID